MATAYLCGTPTNHCCGAQGPTASTKYSRVHQTSESAFKCHATYLVKHAGYAQIGPRTFTKGETEPVLVLTKKSHFGMKIKSGKRGDEGSKGGTAKRFNTIRAGGGVIST